MWPACNSTASVVVSCKTPILVTWVQFPGSAESGLLISCDFILGSAGDDMSFSEILNSKSVPDESLEPALCA